MRKIEKLNSTNQCIAENSKNGLDDFQSYLIGFLQADGHKSKYNEFYLELNIKDFSLLENIKNKLNLTKNISTRIRNTNFKLNAESCVLRIPYEQVKNIEMFIPFGKKSKIIEVPKNVNFSEIDYWRGMIDGDGSLGFVKSTDKPFVSLITSSDNIYNNYKQFIIEKLKINIKINLNRNKRDNVYNIVIRSVDCQMIVNALYYKDCFSLERKYILAKKILNHNVLKSNSFTREEDLIILNNDWFHATKLLNNPKINNINYYNRRKLLEKIKKISMVYGYPPNISDKKYFIE